MSLSASEPASAESTAARLVPARNWPPQQRGGGLWALRGAGQDKLRTVSTQDALKAAEHGNSGVLAAYLHAGGDPHARAKAGSCWALLHLASGCSLVDRGAMSLSLSASQRAQAHGRGNVLGAKLSAFLGVGGGGGKDGGVKRPEPESPDGFATCVSLLLAAGADPNATSTQGFTAIVGACLSDDAEVCRLLLQAGSRPDILAALRKHLGELHRQQLADHEAALAAAKRLRALQEPDKDSVGGGTGRDGKDGKDEGSEAARDPPPPPPALALLVVSDKALRGPGGTPRLLPRSPLGVCARLLECGGDAHGEHERERDVEVRWDVPAPASMALLGCGQVQR